MREEVKKILTDHGKLKDFGKACHGSTLWYSNSGRTRFVYPFLNDLQQKVYHYPSNKPPIRGTFSDYILLTFSMMNPACDWFTDEFRNSIDSVSILADSAESGDNIEEMVSNGIHNRRVIDEFVHTNYPEGGRGWLSSYVRNQLSSQDIKELCQAYEHFNRERIQNGSTLNKLLSVRDSIRHPDQYGVVKYTATGVLNKNGLVSVVINDNLQSLFRHLAILSIFVLYAKFNRAYKL